MNLNEDWTAEIIGQMHKYRITGVQLAEECNNPYGERYDKTGYSSAYLSMVLNGRKKFESDEAKDNTKRTIQAALDRMIEKIKGESDYATQ
ncbi:MAG: hypothetical protein LIP12_00015 [Clostridiales bacterium]|nr:hypothetical protein [Clostridiales bacterium]